MSRIINSRFGSLESGSDLTDWNGEWRLGGDNIGVTVTFADAHQAPERFPEKFENLFLSLNRKDSSFRQAAAKNLLDLYNGTWSEDDQPISADEFVSRIEIGAVSFSEGKETVEIYYDDGNLFAGHAVKVVAFYDGTVKSVALP